MMLQAPKSASWAVQLGCIRAAAAGFEADGRVEEESGVSRIAASWGALAKVGRDSTPAEGETTLLALAEPGGDGPFWPLKLGTRFLGMYDGEWRFR